MTQPAIEPELPLGKQVPPTSDVAAERPYTGAAIEREGAAPAEEPHVVEVEEVQPLVPPAAKALTVGDTDVRSLMRLAIQEGKGEQAVAVLERLVALEERAQERQARMEFFKALADFQAECPPVAKTQKGTNVGRESGVGFDYWYAPLPMIAKHVAPYLKKVGLSYNWDSELDEKGTFITTFFHLRHVGGHVETNKCKLPTASKGGMSEQQKVAAARTFGERMTMIEGLGITTADADTDGQEKDDAPRVTDQQATDLQALAEEVGMDKAKFFAIFAVDGFRDIRQTQFPLAVQTLQRRRERKQHAGGAE